MAFIGNEGGAVSLATAKRWTKNYRDANPGKEVIRAHFFGKEKIDKLLGQPGVVGMRVYFGIDDEKNNVVVLVATKEDENNIYASNEESADEDGPFILNDSVWCPPFCPQENGL